jgi:hypothetical protein
MVLLVVETSEEIVMPAKKYKILFARNVKNFALLI